MTMGLFRTYLLEKGICQWLLLWWNITAPPPATVNSLYLHREKEGLVSPSPIYGDDGILGGGVVLFSSYP